MKITEEINFLELFKIPLCTEEIISLEDFKNGSMRILSNHLDNYHSQARILYISESSNQITAVVVKIKDGLI